MLQYFCQWVGNRFNSLSICPCDASLVIASAMEERLLRSLRELDGVLGHMQQVEQAGADVEPTGNASPAFLFAVLDACKILFLLLNVALLVLTVAHYYFQLVAEAGKDAFHYKVVEKVSGEGKKQKNLERQSTFSSSGKDSVGEARERVLLVVAHPDDETMFFGPVLRHLQEAGAEVRRCFGCPCAAF